MSWKAVFENPTKTSSLRLRDRVSGNFIYLTLRDGVVVGAMGADPSRYVGLTEQQARHKARFSQRGDNPRGYQPGESVQQRYQRLLTEYDEGMAEAEQAERDGYEAEAKQRRRTAQSAMRDADALLRQVEAGKYTWGERY
ncbi:MAG: hypothetical protein AMXMBFR56_82170 [Polyangiaceae bacterium]